MTTCPHFHQNYEEDFAIRFCFKDGRPSYPWRLVFFTSKYDRFIASFDGGKYTNASPEEDNVEYIRVEFNSHRLPCGVLSYILYEDRPDETYSDGVRHTALPVDMPFELWSKASDDVPRTPEYEIALQLMRGYSAYEVAVNNGFKGTIDEWMVSLSTTVEVIDDNDGAVYLDLADVTGKKRTPNIRPYTHALNLFDANYTKIAMRAVEDLNGGKQVVISIRRTAQAPPQSVAVVSVTETTYILATTEVSGDIVDGIAEVKQVRFWMDKTTGVIVEKEATILSSLLTETAVRDDLDNESPTLPISQRQAVRIGRMVDDLDKSKANNDVVTPMEDGLMSSGDKEKLDGIAAKANAYVHPIDGNTRHVSDAEKTVWGAKASTAEANHTAAGLMPSADKQKLDGVAEGANKYIHPDTHSAMEVVEDEAHRFTTDEEREKLAGVEAEANKYVHPVDGNSRHVTDAEKTVWGAKASTAEATHAAKGLMSAADKQKIDGVAEGANKYIHPDTHSAMEVVEDEMHRFVTDAEREKLAGVEVEANKYIHPVDGNTRHVTDAEKSVWGAKASTAEATHAAKGLMSSADKQKIDGVAANANNYAHPADTNTRHVSDAEKTVWSGKASTAEVTTVARGLMSPADKSKLDGVAAGATAYTHPASHPAAMIAEDAAHRFTTDVEREEFRAKPTQKQVSDALAGVVAAEKILRESGDNATLNAAKDHAATMISALVNNSPAALDTLQELATALGGNPNFATDVMDLIGQKVAKVAGKGLSTESFETAEKTKLAGVADGANAYTHPAAHPASMVEQDASRRFVSDAEKTSWSGKAAGDHNHDPSSYHVAHAASSNALASECSIVYGASGLNYYALNVNAGVNPSVPQNPFNDWYHHIVMNFPNGNGYYSDFAVNFHVPEVKFRTIVAGRVGEWIDVWTSHNFDPANKAERNHSHDGLMSAADKIKLNNLPDHAMSAMTVIEGSSSGYISGGVSYYITSAAINITEAREFSNQRDCAMITATGSTAVTFAPMFRKIVGFDDVTPAAAQRQVFVIQRVPVGIDEWEYVVTRGVYD